MTGPDELGKIKPFIHEQMALDILDAAIDAWKKEQSVFTVTAKERDLLKDARLLDKAHYEARIEALIDILRQAVDQAEKEHAASVRACDIHNNTEGVGQRFDYATPKSLPAWYSQANAALAGEEKT